MPAGRLLLIFSHDWNSKKTDIFENTVEFKMSINCELCYEMTLNYYCFTVLEQRFI
jgi:hypothetical protein